MAFNKSFGTCIGPLDFPMSDEGARDLETKLESGEYSPFRFAKSDAYESFSENERSDISVITDGSIDKEGEVIDPDSIDFTEFRKNPVVAFNHNYDLPPVGKSIWQKKTNVGWKAKTQFNSRPKEHPEKEAWFPDTLFHMIKSGSMRGKSIGGAMKMRQPTQEDADRLGFELSKCKRISEKIEIWEYSVCPIGVNNNAIVQAISKSEINLSEDFIKNEMPEVFEALKKFLPNKVEEVLEAGNFRTLNEFNREQQIAINEVEARLIGQMPSYIDQAYKRLMGLVE